MDYSLAFVRLVSGAFLVGSTSTSRDRFGVGATHQELVDQVAVLIRIDKGQSSPDPFRDLFDVLLVAGRHDHGPVSVRLRRNDFLPQTADREHLTAQRQLAAHGNARAGAAPREQADQSRGDRNPCARTVLGTAPAGKWTCRLCCSRTACGMPSFAARAHVVSGHDLDALLHHLAEVARHAVHALPGIRVVSIRRTSPPEGVHASPTAIPGRLRRCSVSLAEARWTEPLVKLAGLDLERSVVASSITSLAVALRASLDVAVEVSTPASRGLDDLAQGRSGYLKLAALKRMLLERFRDQVTARICSFCSGIYPSSVTTSMRS